MRRLPIVVITLCVAACGGGSSDGTDAVETGGVGSGSASGSSGSSGSGSGGEQADSEETPDNEFQLSDSETAGDAHGENPSELEPSETHAAMRLFVVNRENNEPIPGIVIKMTGPDGATYFTRETDSVGYAEVLVPIGRRYEMEYLSLGRRNTMAAVEVRNRPNQNIRLTMRYRRVRPEGPGLVLENVHFATGRATIQSESFPRLDRVVEYLTHHPSVRIKISGHTDNVGNPRRNQRLSEQRARAVREYLIEHGIDGGRIEAEGYGDTRPVASNDTEEGRQQNRRIEAEEL